ncbi:MAG: 16S rRNA (uracil(1498)-N(3))-methyltransferase [Oscillospiraceae bacterium]|nr:16S rRNA (uracil(1498)-N(3))-methyltransferase [Oscillospiraceae bacterium]
MRRFFAELDGVAPGSLVTLPKDEAAHAARTLRLRAGDRVGLIDGLGSSFAAVLVEAGERVSAEIVESLPPNEPRLRTTLYQGLPKLDKLERIIQQSTEIGVDRIVPVLFERCDAKIFSKERAARGNRIARESSKQCGRAVCPPVEPMISFDECAARVSLEENAYLFWERAVEPFAEQFAKRPPGLRRASIIIGPEGGVSDAEAERLVRAGAIPVSLGSRILRTETAPVAALALMLGLYGDMG